MDQQVAFLVHHAALHRNVASQAGQRRLQSLAAVNDQKLRRFQATGDKVLQNMEPGFRGEMIGVVQELGHVLTQPSHRLALQIAGLKQLISAHGVQYPISASRLAPDLDVGLMQPQCPVCSSGVISAMAPSLAARPVERLAAPRHLSAGVTEFPDDGGDTDGKRRAGTYEAVMVDRDSLVAEGTSSNAWMIAANIQNIR